MNNIEEYLSQFEDFELAFFWKYKLDTYMEETQNEIKDYFKKRNLDEVKMNILIEEYSHKSFPDNYSNGYYYNVPLDELIRLLKDAVKEGYTVMWDTDVTNSGWNSRRGYALAIDQRLAKGDTLNPDMPEHSYDQAYRQKLFEELITQDDHLMQITGLSKDKGGKEFFIVKNSWGTHSGPFGGYVYVSIPYFAINTVTIILPKAALNKDLVDRIAVSYPIFYQ